MLNICGRRSGLVVSALDSGSKGLGSSPGRVIGLCFWERHFTLTVPLSTQEYKWVPANYQGNLGSCADFNTFNTMLNMQTKHADFNTMLIIFGVEDLQLRCVL